MTETAPPMSASEPRALSDVAGAWWIFLLTGVGWLLFSIIVFRFDYTTVSAISILFGVFLLAVSVIEAVAAVATHGWRRLGHGLLALASVVIGLVSFAHPGDTFAALAAVMSFYFVLKGAFDFGVAIATRAINELWWLGLLVGIAEILLGFWAAGDFGHKVILLVIWVGAAALTRGIMDIVFAFSLRHTRDAV
jgi:uncharacterized membrane protein HdeD (DUF308 family)